MDRSRQLFHKNEDLESCRHSLLALHRNDLVGPNRNLALGTCYGVGMVRHSSA